MITTPPPAVPLHLVGTAGAPRRLPRPPAAAPVSGVPPIVTHEQTVGDLLAQSGRGMLPLRKQFVQQPRGSATRPGPLSGFVHDHDERALDLYLFVHALASSDPWTCTYPSETWARVLDLSSTCESSSARAGVSKALRRLRDRELITRARDKRRAVVGLLREDGSGDPYTRPVTAADGTWLNLPYAYWREGHHKTLGLPGKAMLLVALSLPEPFVLPQERMPEWYGISADTAGRGLKELRQLQVLSTRTEYLVDHRSPTGYREVQHLTLTGAYSAAARKRAASRRARRPRAARQAAG